uniref:Predicted protein n=1 Tax=Hordeum vulgare subsp. vulgare TaxID=112509 RepID=F2DT45_HORVV|nr:predicted protein [Hordeum vulgare subsp. vulgare]
MPRRQGSEHAGRQSSVPLCRADTTSPRCRHGRPIGSHVGSSRRQPDPPPASPCLATRKPETCVPGGLQFANIGCEGSRGCRKHCTHVFFIFLLIDNHGAVHNCCGRVAQLCPVFAFFTL